MIERVDLDDQPKPPPQKEGDQGGFTVHLDRVFHGPLDLLLQLVREKELEIHVVSLAQVCDAYCQYIRGLKEVDVEEAADFLIVAATLLAIKSRSLLPREEIEAEEDPFEPGEELVQQLLVYKSLRETSDRLAEMREHRRRLLPAGGRWRGRAVREEVEEEEAQLIDLSDLSLWDLLQTFRRLEAETGFSRPHQVHHIGRPLRAFVQEVWQKMQHLHQTTWRRLVASGKGTRAEAAYYLVAVLELAKQHAVDISQTEPFGDVAIRRVSKDVQVNLEEVDADFEQPEVEDHEVDDLLGA
ncbi:MAG: segregation/condensation protein A [Planctomycetota bacterium]|nr:MAG: segregation/condensation protein A [Planctomycetota bacterium]